ncbi:uncharacterized protein LOC143270907 [Peromyscus maniculatus bairdii]|uniref:uncharacterized protein LOC143270907 n=1 Tax=Peromyscus maniculatus bairdii TaxID=230844 RepID=UPI003FD50E5C
MEKVARKPLEPSVDAAPLTAEAKPRKKRKAACQPKSSAPQKTQCYSHPQSAGKIIRKGKRSLPRTTRRKASKKNIKMRIPKQPSETALALLIHEQMSENVNPNAPEQSQPDLESSCICVEDLTSSET